MQSLGERMYELVKRLFPICRSITGSGVRETLEIIGSQFDGLSIHEIPTGTKVFDWEIPKEWNVRNAYVLDSTGKKVIDFQESNLHLVGYSTPMNAKIPFSQLDDHLYSLPEQPDAIPYVTSYYQERWGFCVTHKQRQAMDTVGEYTVFIDSDLKDGCLTLADVIIPGQVESEILLSTYICHPSMANNELSGPVVTSFLASWLLSEPRKYSYRIVFVPETIGSIAYLSEKHEAMRRLTVAGFNISCVGDDRAFSFLPSRRGSTLADRVAVHVLNHLHPDYKRYSYLDRGSDERQYCSPGIDLPVASVMRSKYGEYPEYHTSLDNLDLVTPAGLERAFVVLQKCIECLEGNITPLVAVLCEPQLGRRGLYPTLSTKHETVGVREMMDLIAYSDGTLDLLAIADKIGQPMWLLIPLVKRLMQQGLLSDSTIGGA